MHDYQPDNKRLYCVYRHISPDGKVYVGATSQIPEKRWGKEGGAYRYNVRFYSDIINYGWENFAHEIIESGLTEQEAETKEMELIRKHKSHLSEFGYNISPGKKLWSYSMKLKLSNTMKKRWKNKEYRENSLKKMKISLNLPECKDRLSEVASEMWKKDGFKEKMSVLLKQGWDAPGVKEKKSKSMKKLWENENHRIKLAQIMGSEEYKNKMSEAAKMMWKNPNYVPKHLKQVKCVETGIVYRSLTDAQRDTGADIAAINKCCRGLRKTSKGYHWEWYTE